MKTTPTRAGVTVYSSVQPLYSLAGSAGSGVSVTIWAGNVTERFKQTAANQRKQESESGEGGVVNTKNTHWHNTTPLLQ